MPAGLLASDDHTRTILIGCRTRIDLHAASVNLFLNSKSNGLIHVILAPNGLAPGISIAARLFDPENLDSASDCVASTRTRSEA